MGRDGDAVMNDEWKQRAKELVGAKPAEFDETIYECKICLVAGALQTAYQQGRTDMKEQCMIVVDTCVIRDPTLHKLNQCFAELE